MLNFKNKIPWIITTDHWGNFFFSKVKWKKFYFIRVQVKTVIFYIKILTLLILYEEYCYSMNLNLAQLPAVFAISTFAIAHCVLIAPTSIIPGLPVYRQNTCLCLLLFNWCSYICKSCIISQQKYQQFKILRLLNIV